MKLEEVKAEVTKFHLAIAESQTNEDDDSDDWEDVHEDSDDDKEQYELTGKKVSRRDIQNLLRYAMSIQLMHDTATMKNYGFCE